MTDSTADAQAQTEGVETDATQTDSKANREAARYRTQLRAVEAERDKLAETVRTLRTQAAENALADVLAQPSSLWMAGHDVAEFYDEAGTLDVERLREAAAQAVAEKGIAPKRRFEGGADGGPRGTGEVVKPPTWADAFRRRNN